MYIYINSTSISRFLVHYAQTIRFKINPKTLILKWNVVPSVCIKITNLLTKEIALLNLQHWWWFVIEYFSNSIDFSSISLNGDILPLPTQRLPDLPQSRLRPSGGVPLHLQLWDSARLPPWVCGLPYLWQQWKPVRPFTPGKGFWELGGGGHEAKPQWVELPYQCVQAD